MRIALALLLLLALAPVARADYSPPLVSATCPTGYWSAMTGPAACVPSELNCQYLAFFAYWNVSSRIIERTWYRGTYDDYYDSICWDRSPWPTSWTGPAGVNHFSWDDTPAQQTTLRAWKREYSGGPCHCYTSTDGFNWGPERTCYAGPIECY